MPRTDALQGAMDLLVLKVLARRGPLHGYGIMTAIEEVSGEALRVEEGSLYPALHRIEEGGFIKASWITKENGRRARVYELTRAGQEHLVEEEERWLAVSNAVRRVLRMA